MKLFITILALINGSYMLADGLFVMLKGKYTGPNKPGPRVNLFYKLNIDVFKPGQNSFAEPALLIQQYNGINRWQK